MLILIQNNDLGISCVVEQSFIYFFNSNNKVILFVILLII